MSYCGFYARDLRASPGATQGTLQAPKLTQRSPHGIHMGTQGGRKRAIEAAKRRLLQPNEPQKGPLGLRVQEGHPELIFVHPLQLNFDQAKSPKGPRTRRSQWREGTSGDPRAWYPLPRNRSQRKHKLQQIHFLRLNRCGIFYVINPSGANTVLANFPLRREQSLFRNAELQGYSSTRNKNNAAPYHVRTGGRL